MRGALAKAPVFHPLSDALPTVFQPEQDDKDKDLFLRKFMAGLDQVLAPVISTLDNLWAYFDPAVAPDDFVAWLAEWVGLPLDPNWKLADRRQLVATAIDLHGSRGTREGLRNHVRLYTGYQVEVSDISDAGTPARGLSIKIVVTVPAGENVDRERLERIVTAAKPAHVAHKIEVVGP